MSRKKHSHIMQRKLISAIIVIVGSAMLGLGMLTWLAGWNIPACITLGAGYASLYMGACVGDL